MVKVRINLPYNKRYHNKTGIVLRWVHDQWYIVEVDGKELVLDADRGEFESNTSLCHKES